MMEIYLPSVFAFPGVDFIDTSQTEFQMFESHFQTTDHDHILRCMNSKIEVRKSARLSEMNRQHGNNMYRDNNYNTALEFYYLSLAFAPYDSLEYAFAIANRTAALFSLKRYEECLADINHIWFTKYPEENYYKIYIRQSSCYINLKKYLKATESARRARQSINRFMRSVNKTQFEIIQRHINNLFSRIKPPEIRRHSFEFPGLTLKNGENPKFLNASNVVDIRMSGMKGRYVAANTDIEEGDVLFMETPYSAIRVDDISYRYTYCNHCFSYTPATVPCSDCIVHFYCSENCKQQAWDKGHKWECFGERKNLLRSEMRLVLNTLFEASRSNFNNRIQDQSKFGNLDDNYAYVDKLVSNKETMTSEQLRNFIKVSIWLVVYLREYTDYFQWLLKKQPVASESTLHHLHNFVGGILLILCMKIHCNGTELMDLSLRNLNEFHVEKDLIGYGLYVSTSMINHSCTPNALVCFHRSMKIIRAIKKIPKNTEVCINYAYFFIGTEKIKQNFFLNEYKFSCTCAKCSNPLVNKHRPWLCNRCKGRAFHLTTTHVKCTSCQRIYSIVRYRSIEQMLVLMHFKAVITSNTRLFELIYGLMKRLYYPDHEEFANYYMLAYNFYFRQRNYLKCIHSCISFIQYCANMDEVTEYKLQAYLRFLNSIAAYYGLTRTNQSPDFYHVNSEFQEALSKARDMLQYFVSPQNLKIYENCCNDYLLRV